MQLGGAETVPTGPSILEAQKMSNVPSFQIHNSARWADELDDSDSAVEDDPGVGSSYKYALKLNLSSLPEGMSQRDLIGKFEKRVASFKWTLLKPSNELSFSFLNKFDLEFANSLIDSGRASAKLPESPAKIATGTSNHFGKPPGKNPENSGDFWRRGSRSSLDSPNWRCHMETQKDQGWNDEKSRKMFRRQSKRNNRPRENQKPIGLST